MFLFPSIKTVSGAISLAQTNENLEPDKRLKLLGDNVLENPYTLVEGNSAVEGLIIVVPWVLNYESDYAKEALKRWGKISWRTASSFDATQAFIKSLSADITRQELLNNLKSLNLKPENTSGDSLQFKENGDPKREVYLAIVVNEEASNSIETEYKFQHFSPDKEQSVSKCLVDSEE